MRSLTFENPVFISGVDGVISIELNIDWTNVSFGLIKTNVDSGNSIVSVIVIKSNFYTERIKKKIKSVYIGYSD